MTNRNQAIVIGLLIIAIALLAAVLAVVVMIALRNRRPLATVTLDRAAKILDAKAAGLSQVRDILTLVEQVRANPEFRGNLAGAALDVYLAYWVRECGSLAANLDEVRNLLLTHRSGLARLGGDCLMGRQDSEAIKRLEPMERNLQSLLYAALKAVRQFAPDQADAAAARS